MNHRGFDMAVIGSGPAGQRAAIQAAKLGKRVVLIERSSAVGGAQVNSGTIPSKALREASLYLSGHREHGVYGLSYMVKEDVRMEDLLFRADKVVQHEVDVVRHQLKRNHIELIHAEASFVDRRTLQLAADSRVEGTIEAERIVIACGTRAARDADAPFDGQRVFTSDDLVALQALPRTLTIVGAGIIGLECASMFAALGVRVTIVDMRPRLLPFVDHEIVSALEYEMRKERIVLRLGEEVAGVSHANQDEEGQLVVRLASGKQILSEKVLYSTGRTPNTDSLNLSAAGITPLERGLLKVDASFQTEQPGIFAVGDVIGFPSLASSSMEQGRLAACHAFGREAPNTAELFPLGIYTVPEISCVGKTEEELTEQRVPYEAGKASYREVARGQLVGDSEGLLKLLVHLETRKILGVHIIGEGATELIHIGQAVMAHEGTVDYFINNVFNYPTLAQCYKTAAFDAINRIWA